MSGASRISVGTANSGASIPGPSSPQGGAIFDALRATFPQHARKALRRVLGLSDGGARKKLTGERNLSPAEIATLLRSDHGLEFLTVIMADARPRWWVQVQAAFKLGAMRRRKQELQEAIHEAEQLGDTLSRAETALRVSDEDFHGAHADALGSLRRDLAGAVARRGR
jgi:hypothetical protein